MRSPKEFFKCLFFTIGERNFPLWSKIYAVTVSRTLFLVSFKIYIKPRGKKETPLRFFFHGEEEFDLILDSLFCPGPQMWMEIQRGEGPTADALQGPVYLGETLTMVFTLADDVFRFDTNVIQCWASDGTSSCAHQTVSKVTTCYLPPDKIRYETLPHYQSSVIWTTKNFKSNLSDIVIIFTSKLIEMSRFYKVYAIKWN